MSRADAAARVILEGIADGRYALGAQLPSEAQLAEESGVSRLTAREAVRDLAARGVLTVRHGTRALVSDPRRWDLLDPELMGLRGALLGEERQLAVLREALQEMIDAEQDEDVARAVEADLRFHQVIVEATGNEFLAATYRPLTQVMHSVRLRTSATAGVPSEAIRWHRRILEALQEHDVTAAVAAMRGHMDQTSSALIDGYYSD